MFFRLSILFAFLITVNASCQNSASKKETESSENIQIINEASEVSLSFTNAKLDLSKLRKTLEEEVRYPEGQLLRLDRMEKPVPGNMPKMIFLGYYDGAFHFRQEDKDGKELEEYLPYHFHWDNYEPIVVRGSKIEFDIPDNNHLICAYIVDAKGHRIIHAESLVAKMIKVEDQEIVRSDDPPGLVYYNQPREEYRAEDPYIYMDFIIVQEGEQGISGLVASIDNQPFQLTKSGTYQIKGLLPGAHMVELQLYRLGEKYNPPLSPSRMRFYIK